MDKQTGLLGPDHTNDALMRARNDRAIIAIRGRKSKTFARAQAALCAGWLAMLLTLCSALLPSAQAAIVNLQAYVLLEIYQSDGTTPLPDGSIVQIIGSFDNVMDAPEELGGGLTGDTTGDDVILSVITINSADLGIPGTFFSGNTFFESDDIKYMYIRFYDTTSYPLSGTVDWGQSSTITNAEHVAFNVLEMDFVGGFTANETDTFVVIPEPATTHLVLTALLLVWALRARARHKAQARIHLYLTGRPVPVTSPVNQTPPQPPGPETIRLLMQIEQGYIIVMIVLALLFVGVPSWIEMESLEYILRRAMIILLVAMPFAVGIAAERIAVSAEYLAKRARGGHYDYF